MSGERGLRAAEYKPSPLTLIAANRRVQLETRAVLQREVIVPDVSFYQDKNTTPQGIDFARMKEAGAQGVIIRAGQGNWEDEDFKTNWGNAEAAGLPRGSYWYYDPRVSAKGQADKWAGLLAADMPELDIWLDAEYPDAWGGAWAGWSHLYDFLERVKFWMPNARLSVYTGYYWWYDHVWSKTTAAQLAYFLQYPLCIAWYAADPAVVKIPKPWTTARWWQWTSSGDGLMYGAESLEIDLNYFNGDLEAYKDTFGLGTVPPPPAGGDMIYANAVLVSALNGRDAPDGAVVWQGGLKLNDTLLCDEKSGYWYKVKAVIRGGVNIPLPAPAVWASAGSTGSYQRVISSFETTGALPTLTIAVNGGELYNSVAVELAPK